MPLCPPWRARRASRPSLWAGVPCTEETVLDGSYQIQRPFVMVTRESEALNPAAQAFFDWAVSADAADLIRQAGAVPLA